ncbi:glycosyltransferase, partial [Anaerococcus porci]|uniref:glycosyltransferase n=1 Tax=Anaerococcus porci TaxID=2652269 RepID=UPI002A75A8A8
FLDSDDLYEVNFVEKMLYKIRKNDDDIVACGAYLKENNKKIEYKNKFIERNILYNFIIGRNNFHTSTFIIKREFIIDNNIYFYNGLSWGEDLAFFMKAMSNTKKISLVKEFMTVYNIESDSKSLSNFEIEKVDKDFEFSSKVLNDKNVHFSNKERNAFINFKFAGLIIYRLIESIDRGYDINLVKKYYNKYKKYIENISMKQGLRSLKLFVNKQKLERLLK